MVNFRFSSGTLLCIWGQSPSKCIVQQPQLTKSCPCHSFQNKMMKTKFHQVCHSHGGVLIWFKFYSTLDPGMGCHYPLESGDDFEKGCGRTCPFRLYSRTLICCSITGQDFEWFGISILIWGCLVSESTRNPFNADVEGWWWTAFSARISAKYIWSGS